MQDQKADVVARQTGRTRYLGSLRDSNLMIPAARAFEVPSGLAVIRRVSSEPENLSLHSGVHYRDRWRRLSRRPVWGGAILPL